MILVDTSVLIDFFRGRENSTVDKLGKVITENIPFGINQFVYQEILQGAATEKEFDLLKTYLDTQTFYALHHGNDSFAAAAKIYVKCRKIGVTVSSTIDLLIVQTALENNLALLHNDRDFVNIKKAVPELTFF
jgi:predicted nucleic acid-binding protein